MHWNACCSDKSSDIDFVCHFRVSVVVNLYEKITYTFDNIALILVCSQFDSVLIQENGIVLNESQALSFSWETEHSLLEKKFIAHHIRRWIQEMSLSFLKVS